MDRLQPISVSVIRFLGLCEIKKVNRVSNFPQTQCFLNDQDELILFYTDGITKAMNEKK